MIFERYFWVQWDDGNLTGSKNKIVRMYMMCRYEL